MARKRAKKEVKKIERKKQNVIDYSKMMTDFAKEYKVNLQTNFDVEQFNELLKLSNNAGAVMQDISEKELMVIKLTEIVRRIKSGEIKPPLWQQLFPGAIDTKKNIVSGITLAQFTEMPSAIAMLEKNINATKDAIQFGKGQLGHRHEEYVDALIRRRDRLNKTIGDAVIKRISPHRIGAKVDAKESEVFDKGFESFEKETAKKKKESKQN
jgi:hypothetical protein